MTHRFIVRKRAELDINAAFNWYESQQLGLGYQFLTSVREGLEHIRDLPEAFAVIYGQVRRAVVPRFPYLIFYIAQPDRVSVLAVLHHSRNPATWPRRR